MTSDWLSNLLDHHPGESAPDDFGDRLRVRLQAEPQGRKSTLSGRPVLRPAFGRWAGFAAAAVLLLSFGFWLGSGRPPVNFIESTEQTDPLVLAEIYQIEGLLQDLNVLQNGDLELAFQQATKTDWLEGVPASEGGEGD